MSAQICVITPCLNPGPFLLPCLHSVEAQGDVIRRHIVMDGGSTDGAVETLSRYALSHPQVLWRSEPDKGQSDALNKALSLVDTEYFGWLNADDLYQEGGIRALLADTGGVPGVVYGDYTVVDETGRVLRVRRQPTFSYWDCLYGYLTVPNVAAIFRTAAAREAGGFDESLRFAMDYDLVLKMGRLEQVRHVRTLAGAFRMHGHSKTSTLQDVCARETQIIRRKHSGRSGVGLAWRFWFAQARVLARMVREGCLGCRMGRLTSEGGSGSTQEHRTSR